MRSGRYKGFTSKDRIKDMEEFKRTGRHPEIEEVRARAAKEMLHPLPDVDLGRPHTFFDFSSNGRDLGELHRWMCFWLGLTAPARSTMAVRCSPCAQRGHISLGEAVRCWGRAKLGKHAAFKTLGLLPCVCLLTDGRSSVLYRIAESCSMLCVQVEWWWRCSSTWCRWRRARL